MSYLLMICYDISSNRDRLAIINVLQSRGERVQKSVFACHVEQLTERDNIMQEIAPHIRAPGDTIRYYQLCPKDRNAILHDGCSPSEEEPDYVIS